MAFQLRYVTHSEIGLVRKNNQDSGYASARLMVVADGMGGAAAGDLASAVAIDAIRKIDAPIAGEEMLEVLTGAIGRANDRIADLVSADHSLEGMGTTVTGALFDGTQLGLAHIGDSRAYLMRNGTLERLTHDHSWVQSLVDDGKITPEEATVHPHRSLLLKVLNGQPSNEPDLTMVAVEPGDRLLICSDGLCGLVDDPVIAEAMALPDLKDALQQLVAEALAEGGIDNITVIVADVVEADGHADVQVLGAAAERDIPSAQTKVRDTAAGGAAALSVDSDAGDGEDTISTRRTVAPAGSQDDDEARYNPRPPHRRRLARPLLGLLVLLLIAGAGLTAGYAWTRTQFYVGASGAQVAIFQGLTDPLPGLGLSSVYEIQALLVADLPPYYQDKVRTSIEVASLDGARQTIAELTEAAKRCAARKPTERPSAPTTTAEVTATKSASSPTASAKPPAVAKPSPSPTPTSTPTTTPPQNC